MIIDWLCQQVSQLSCDTLLDALTALGAVFASPSLQVSSLTDHLSKYQILDRLHLILV